MKFKCEKCGEETYTNRRMYKCLNCGSIPPIDDYKEAFADLLEQYEEKEISARIALRNLNSFADRYKKERNFFVITTIMSVITIISMWLI